MVFELAKDFPPQSDLQCTVVCVGVCESGLRLSRFGPDFQTLP